MRVSLSGHAPRKSRRISLTPLADLVFILLVFFILETSFIDFRQLDFRLPENKTEGESVAGYVEVQLFSSGRIWIDGSTLEVAGVGGYFRTLNTDAETLVILKAEDTVPLQLLVSAMDQLDSAEMNKVLVQRLEQ
ncbi:MAG: biopolymer transporter ExbD [Porticoccaceae bacterium]